MGEALHPLRALGHAGGESRPIDLERGKVGQRVDEPGRPVRGGRLRGPARREHADDVIDPASPDHERQRVESRQAQPVGQRNGARAARPAGAGGDRLHDALLGRGDRQGISRVGRVGLDGRDVALRQPQASQDVALRSILVRGDDQRERCAQVVGDAPEDDIEGHVEALAASDRPDGGCKRAGCAGRIKVAHEASTSGSGGGPATRVGMARMIRAVPRKGNDLIVVGEMGPRAYRRCRDRRLYSAP